MAHNIRNVAIIAHVDHGKTTLVDALIRQSKTRLGKDQAGQDLIMDSNPLERERGITIFSKNAAVRWRETKINIIDTPGHADFGGEVQRVLSMADGCLLLVDAQEGPMPQTRFVLKEALRLQHRIIVVINKIDKPHARINFAVDKTFDLFVELGADDKSLDFPIVYASAKQGRAGFAPDLQSMADISPVFEAILKHVPEPEGDPQKPLQMLVSTIAADNFKGRIATGRVVNGSLRAKEEVMHINRKGDMTKCRLTSVMVFEGLEKIEADHAIAGEIVAVAGIPDVNIGETIASVQEPAALPLLEIDEPTVKLTVLVNDSPFAGREGSLCTSRQIRERLYKELETDMALRIEDCDPRSWIVSGRGELHLAILLERMRREGYEFQVSRPQVINKFVDGKVLTPFEQVFIEAPEDLAGAVIQKLGSRNGKLQRLVTENRITYLDFFVPTRGLFGYRSEFLTDTRGLGIINTVFDKYGPDPGSPREREQGSLVSTSTGMTNLYGLLQIQDRGVLFVGPGVEIYEGQVVGQNAKPQDIRVNVCKAKRLSNMRSKGEGTSAHLNTPKIKELEDALQYIFDDELVEVTPQSVRIRKIVLNEAQKRRQEKTGVL